MSIGTSAKWRCGIGSPKTGDPLPASPRRLAGARGSERGTFRATFQKAYGFLVFVVVVFVVVEFVVVVPPLFALAAFEFDAFEFDMFEFDVLVVDVLVVDVVELVVTVVFVLVRLVLALLVLVVSPPHAIVPATNRPRAIAVSVFFIESSRKAINTAVFVFANPVSAVQLIDPRSPARAGCPETRPPEGPSPRRIVPHRNRTEVLRKSSRTTAISPRAATLRSSRHEFV
jgi:hypothetical protein